MWPCSWTLAWKTLKSTMSKDLQDHALPFSSLSIEEVQPGNVELVAVSITLKGCRKRWRIMRPVVWRWKYRFVENSWMSPNARRFRTSSIEYARGTVMASAGRSIRQRCRPLGEMKLQSNLVIRANQRVRPKSAFIAGVPPYLIMFLGRVPVGTGMKVLNILVPS